MILVNDHLGPGETHKRVVPLKTDRRTLAKRRWKASADDETEFGFDLPHPIKNGTPFYETDDCQYRIEQTPENVLRIPFQDPKQAAYYGWMVGNLHFSADFDSDAVIAEDDPAIRQMLDRNHIAFTETTAVFEPVIVSHGHHH